MSRFNPMKIRAERCVRLVCRGDFIGFSIFRLFCSMSRLIFQQKPVTRHMKNNCSDGKTSRYVPDTGFPPLKLNVHARVQCKRVRERLDIALSFPYYSGQHTVYERQSVNRWRSFTTQNRLIQNRRLTHT